MTTVSRTDGPVIGICSLKDDLHALAIQHALGTRGVQCHVFETDDFVHHGGLSWSIGEEEADAPPHLRNRTGEWVDVRTLDLIWWRRAGFPQRPHDALADDGDRALVTNEWKYALHGLLATMFRGRWVNDPSCNRRAENKLVQLAAARAVGLRIPPTLVSADPARVRAFCSRHVDTGVIVKAVRGARRRFLWAARVKPSDLDDDGITLCPAIYQPFIPGSTHLRLCCFGDDVTCFETVNSDVDSRGDINAPIREITVDRALAQRVHSYLRALDLRMAIMDAKKTPSGDIVWLEANPQGQFLYAEGLTGVDLTARFTDFLLREARS